jgi:hypothetical protein
MPWHISHGHSSCASSKPWAVIKDSDGSVVGCHETEDSAKAQLAALNASENSMSNEYYFPAHVESKEMPEAVESMLRDMIKGDLGGQSPYFFRAEISSDRLDSHFTHMLNSSLQNFATESENGISFLDSHQRYKLGIGYTLTGSCENSNGVTRVISDIYTVPGINLGNHSYASTDDFIRAMRAALVRKVSVGFHGGDMLCDICGYSFWDFRNCKHWPGRKYMVTDDNGVDIETVSTFGISDAHLAEVSAVYEGSTPGAMILRAEGMAQAGLLDSEEIRRLETQYRIKLPAGQRIWPVKEEIQENGEKQMEELEQIKEILKGIGTPHGHGDAVKGIQWLADDRARLATENARLTPLADQGREYRADLIKEALAEGVRALGKDFHAETYELMFESADIAHIKRMRDDWKRQGDLIFKGKRLTVDGEEQPITPAPAPTSAVPDAAYRS